MEVTQERLTEPTEARLESIRAGGEAAVKKHSLLPIQNRRRINNCDPCFRVYFRWCALLRVVQDLSKQLQLHVA